MDGRILPEAFQLAYEQLWVMALGDGGPGSGVGNHPLNGSSGEVGRASGKVEGGGWRISSGKPDQMVTGGKTGPKQKQVGKTSRTLKDERAFKLKQKVDKQLRRIAAQIRAFEDGRNLEIAGQRVCSGRCKRYGEADWSYCANCGGPMRDLDPQE